jgi:hypothetical protein
VTFLTPNRPRYRPIPCTTTTSEPCHTLTPSLPPRGERSQRALTWPASRRRTCGAVAGDPWTCRRRGDPGEAGRVRLAWPTNGCPPVATPLHASCSTGCPARVQGHAHPVPTPGQTFPAVHLNTHPTCCHLQSWVFIFSSVVGCLTRHESPCATL